MRNINLTDGRTNSARYDVRFAGMLHTNTVRASAANGFSDAYVQPYWRCMPPKRNHIHYQIPNTAILPGEPAAADKQKRSTRVMRRAPTYARNYSTIGLGNCHLRAAHNHTHSTTGARFVVLFSTGESRQWCQW